MGEQPPEAGVVGVVGGENTVSVVDGHSHPLFCILGEVGAALVVTVDILPGLGIGKGELIGSETDDGAVLSVEALHDSVEVTALQREDIGDAGDGPELGTGKAREGIDVEVVDCICQEVLGMIRGGSAFENSDISRTVAAKERGRRKNITAGF